MTRLRLVLIALALGVLVPSGFLVQRALLGAVAERQARHRGVAEVVFDEMERRLGELVQREESRPHGQYRSRWIPDPAPGIAPVETDSPLAAPPAEPFMLGYFQIDPDGTLTQPHEGARAPRDQVARAASAWSSAVAPARVEQAKAGSEPEDERAKEARQAVDLYRAVGKKGRAEPRGGQRVETLPAQNVRVFAPAIQIELPPETPAGREIADREAKGAAVTVVVDPLVGRRVSPDRLVLLRSVLIDGRTFRQGFVIDVPALQRHLLDAAVAGTELEGAVAIEWDAPERDRRDEGFPHAYGHRFLDPLETMSATLYLRELPSADGTRTVIALAAMLALAGGLGLLAVERMAATRLAFARRREDFVAAVTHELKTPLTAIRMHAEMLRDGMATTEAKRRQYLETVTAEAERLSRLVDDVLTFSRLERGTRARATATGDVRDAIAEAASALRPQAGRAGYELEIDVPEAPCPARFDGASLVQILVNVVDNALKYAASAEDRRITLACRPGPGRVRLSVRDRGPGVPEEHLPHVFEPFYRGERELTRTTTGTGIGLALVRGLAAEMGARIEARNADGGGFEVIVDLPA